MRAPRLPWRETCCVCNARPASARRSMTCGRLSVYDSPLERWPPALQDVAAELGQFIQEEHAIVGQRHLARHRYVAAADQPRIRDGMVGRAKRAGRDQRRAVAGEAGDAVDTRGLNGLGEGHRRQDGGESACQHRLARPWRTKEEDVMVRTPASPSASPVLWMPSATAVDLLWQCKSTARRPTHDNSSSSALASCRSAVSKPSVNQP